MARDSDLLEKLFQQRTLRGLARATRDAVRMTPGILRHERHGTPLLHDRMGNVIHRAEEGADASCAGVGSIPAPYNADWAWRPELWCGPLAIPGISPVQNKAMLGREITVFHDCIRSEITLRQVRNRQDRDLAPYGLRMDVFHFDGSFLSLVFDLPNQATAGLKRTHVLRMAAIVESDEPTTLFARANVQHGPNTEQVVRELPLHAKDAMVEFDLAYTDLREDRVDRAWIDLIVEGPETNRITLRDLSISRRPRAAF